MEDVEANENEGFQKETSNDLDVRYITPSAPNHDEIDIATEGDDEAEENEDEETNIDEEAAPIPNKIDINGGVGTQSGSSKGSGEGDDASSASGSSKSEELDYHDKMRASMDVLQGTVSGASSMNANRLVTKEGIVDVKYINSPGIKTRFMRDLFHTLMDAKWRINCILFTLSFLITWVFFGCIWYIIVKYHGEKCVDSVKTWTQAFLFSIETQTTIGYGGRAVTADCPEGVILLVLQTLTGMFISSFMLGLMFGKLARPKNRGKTIMFSKTACITVRDGYFVLAFRYADLCRRVLLDTNMRMVIIRPRMTDEGEYIPLDMADLALTIDYEQVEYTARLFPLIPITVIHMIDEDSPLYKFTKQSLAESCERQDFEIIGILEGTVPTTGNTTQALTSYRPNEILWGHRFKPIELEHKINMENGMNNIDLNTIHDTVPEEVTPEYSAERYDELNPSSSSSSSDSD